MKNRIRGNRFQGQQWYEFWIRNLWRYPNRLLALKAAISMGVLLIPFVAFQMSFIGVTLALGALAGALSETDDHPKGRIKALLLTVLSFVISSASVQLLLPYPILFGIGLVGSTVTFILIGGLGERYRGITFGALLIAIYTMLGAEISPNWYLQIILLPAGALFYGLLSLILLYLHPARLLEEQLADGFENLSLYMKEKSKLFPSDKSIQKKTRQRLASLNVQMIASLGRCKNVLNSYADAIQDSNELRPYLHKFILLQSLHERAASSHERYDLLSSDSDNREILEGLGQLMLQLSLAAHEVSKSLLMGTEYHHPVSIKWTINAIKTQLKEIRKSAKKNDLGLLLQNLNQSHISLQNMNFNVSSGFLPRVDKDTNSLWNRFTSQLNWNHPKLKYAFRLSTCFLLGYILMLSFDIEKGYWILLTSLFVCQPSYSETRQRLFQRILGTITGVVIGVSVVQILPTAGGQVVLLLVASYLFFSWLKRNYATSVIFVTIFVIAAFNLIADKGVVVMIPRVIDTVIGAALAILVVRFMWPDWQYKQLPNLLASAVEKNRNYFNRILLEHESPSEDDLPYRISRYQAHQADSSLSLAWRGMKLEPKRHQKLQKRAFSITYLNHALLSYLSALGAHRSIADYMNDEVKLMYQEVEKTLHSVALSLRKNDSQCSSEELNLVLEKIGDRLEHAERGTQRQKLVLLYNIAEVTQQLVQKASQISEE
ncbi:YccS family putative transporter [Marinifilum caeruleilacunae]|uniref:TIGR01666 family membrane protein n=1 Tax=Marinifilum caeruleilacunae TaxID=2499076 RepID=A0ABX1WTT8_9BACT|nr:YccS family putative transporter [Marinifilum caeruleilacunae]NOU59345.1 TIGR01666 family membrane protein [Marinifilum caeruleilacunae]